MDQAGKISDLIIDFVQNDLGEEAEDAIPGLITAVVVMALMTSDPQQALDEAASLLDMPEMQEV